MSQTPRKAGESLSLVGHASYWLQIGEPEAVRVFVGDELQELPGGGGLFMVTEDGVQKIG